MTRPPAPSERPPAAAVAPASPHPHESLRTYVSVYVALLALLVVTVAAAFVPIGRWAIVVAMVVAAVKAALVVTYFMHVRLSSGLTRLFAIGAFFWLGVLGVLTINDYLTRGWLPGSRAWMSEVDIPAPPGATPPREAIRESDQRAP